MPPRTSFFSKSSSSLFALLALLSLMWMQAPAAAAGKKGFRPVQKLLDVSGLVWVGGDTFLAVHDAKYPDEKKLTRVSLIQLPKSLDGLQWKPLRPRFPGRRSSDLESAARVPGTRKVLLVESGDDHSPNDRIYLARAGKHKVRIVDATDWSTFYDAGNIEATAVAQTDDGLLFIWAERAQGESSTRVQWTDLKLRPFRIGQSGEIGQADFTLPEELAALYSRPDARWRDLWRHRDGFRLRQRSLAQRDHANRKTRRHVHRDRRRADCRGLLRRSQDRERSPPARR